MVFVIGLCNKNNGNQKPNLILIYPLPRVRDTVYLNSVETDLHCAGVEKMLHDFHVVIFLRSHVLSSTRFPCMVLFSKSDSFKANEMPHQQWEGVDQYGWKIEKKCIV